MFFGPGKKRENKQNKTEQFLHSSKMINFDFIYRTYIKKNLPYVISARNSTTKPKCRRCRTGYYCVGDGTEEKCGVTSPTEFSFGGATNCSACWEGWVRNDVNASSNAL